MTGSEVLEVVAMFWKFLRLRSSRLALEVHVVWACEAVTVGTSGGWWPSPVK
jgi:hypothetical protein